MYKRQEDWVAHVQERPKDKPFFFWFAASDAHRTWALNEQAPTYDNASIVIPPYLVDTEKTREDLSGYYHEVSRFDHFIGLVTAELRQQGVLDDTLIVVAADNGRPFPRCKSRLYDSGIKTPWVVHYPRLITTPAITQSLVSVIDFSATCLELAGVDRPDSVQGRSFVPILRDPQVSVREVVFSEHNWHVYKNHERMLRFGNFVYIKNSFTDQPNLCYESDTHYPAGRELWEAHAAGRTTAQQQQVFANPCPAEELYRLSNDPDQFNNLVKNPNYSKELDRARRLLTAWTQQTGDTIPEHPTPHRHAPPRIENGTILPPGSSRVRNPHSEMPGAARNAMTINHPGPLLSRE